MSLHCRSRSHYFVVLLNLRVTVRLINTWNSGCSIKSRSTNQKNTLTPLNEWAELPSRGKGWISQYQLQHMFHLCSSFNETNQRADFLNRVGIHYNFYEFFKQNYVKTLTKFFQNPHEILTKLSQNTFKTLTKYFQNS
jgi:hypothetical protein